MLSFGGDFGDRRPDPQVQLDQLFAQLKRIFSRRLMIPLAGLIAAIWIATGIYMVGPGEVAVVRQFGREIAQTQPGLRFRLPWPIQTHNVVDVRSVRSVEIGFRTVSRPGFDGQRNQRVPEEALMLTGDENIVEVHLFVQYVVQDPSKFLFRARDPESTLAAAAEVALRSIVGRNTIDHTMTDGRVEVQAAVEEYLQGLLDEYETGLLATETRLLTVDAPDQVRNAFHDVVRAWEDRERLTQEAEGYREDIIPRARGEAQEIIRRAEGYREQRILRADGEATRFVSILSEYRKAPDVTRDRIYLETMERVLPDTQKYILTSEGADVLPLLSIGGRSIPGESSIVERRSDR